MKESGLEIKNVGDRFRGTPCALTLFEAAVTVTLMLPSVPASAAEPPADYGKYAEDVMFILNITERMEPEHTPAPMEDMEFRKEQTARETVPYGHSENRTGSVPIYVNGKLSAKHLKRICSMGHMYEITFRDVPDSPLMKMLIEDGCSFSINPAEFVRLGITEIPYTEDERDYPLNEYGAEIPKVPLVPSDMLCRTRGIRTHEVNGDDSREGPAVNGICTPRLDEKITKAFGEKLRRSVRRIIKNLEKGKLPVLNRTGAGDEAVP